MMNGSEMVYTTQNYKKHKNFKKISDCFVFLENGLQRPLYSRFKVNPFDLYLDLIQDDSETINETVAKEIVCQLLVHLDIENDDVRLIITNDAKKQASSYVGLYSQLSTNSGQIILNYSGCIPDEAISILCHETMHHFLIKKGVKKENTADNEYLTDIAAVFAGMANYFVLGYQEHNRYQRENGKLTNKTCIEKIGYASTMDVECAATFYKDSLNKRLTDWQDVAKEKIFKLEKSIQNNKTLFNKAFLSKNLKFSNSEDSALLAKNAASIQFGDFDNWLSHLMKISIIDTTKIKEFDTWCIRADNYNEIISSYNRVLNQLLNQ